MHMHKYWETFSMHFFLICSNKDTTSTSVQNGDKGEKLLIP